jgi:hypothetical protein
MRVHSDINECEQAGVQEFCETKFATCVNMDGKFECRCPSGQRMIDNAYCAGTCSLIVNMETILKFRHRRVCNKTITMR